MAPEAPSPSELRYRAASALLQVGEPLALTELVQRCGVTGRALLPALRELEAKGLVVQGELVPGQFGPHYCISPDAFDRSKIMWYTGPVDRWSNHYTGVARRDLCYGRHVRVLPESRQALQAGR